MRFEIGSEIDVNHCRALTHEYFKCDDAFNLFMRYAEITITSGETPELSYRMYNAYSSFLHHLYEFLLGCFARDMHNTNITNKKGDERIRIIECMITSSVQRVFSNIRDAIKRGEAPSWVNHISYYDITVPENFAADFRQYRNKVSGHVSHERASELSLSEFYQKYHKILVELYYEAKYMWGKKPDNFPDLKEITDFSVIARRHDNA